MVSVAIVIGQPVLLTASAPGTVEISANVRAPSPTPTPAPAPAPAPASTPGSLPVPVVAETAAAAAASFVTAGSKPDAGRHTSRLPLLLGATGL
jgi:hypothetical protein